MIGERGNACLKVWSGDEWPAFTARHNTQEASGTNSSAPLWWLRDVAASDGLHVGIPKIFPLRRGVMLKRHRLVVFFYPIWMDLQQSNQHCLFSWYLEYVTTAGLESTASRCKIVSDEEPKRVRNAAFVPGQRECHVIRAKWETLLLMRSKSMRVHVRLLLLCANVHLPT